MQTKDQNYFPPPESAGGWRYLQGNDEIEGVAGMDPQKIEDAFQEQAAFYGDSFSIVIIRHGYLVKEYHTFNVLVPSRFDIWSCTKTLTGTAWGILFDDHNKMDSKEKNPKVNLDSHAYVFLPEGMPLSDHLKEKITFRHLLTMTSGIPGEDHGVAGNPTSTTVGQFEHALGKFPNRFGKWTNKLYAEPGNAWDYSDPAFVHLSLAFFNITGTEISQFMEERVFEPIGIENLSWDVQGGSGFIGPHTNPHTGAHISARELARFGYLALHKGRWNGKEILPEWWQELVTKSSQNLNPSYGYTWWVNTPGIRWPGLPRDMFAMEGFRSNRCYVIPSLDMVVARVGSGPSTWHEPGLITRLAKAIL
jgi:CubicO group peptidase (beta-lactamase class C family)